jgi:magnesium transporter
MLKIFEKKKGIFRKGSLDEIQSSSISWLNCYSPTTEELSKISKKVRIPEERLLHFIDEDARPHILNTRDFSAILWGIPTIEENRLKREIVAVFLLPNSNILTLSNKEIEIVKNLEERIIKKGEIIKAPSNFLQALVSETVTKLFSIMEQLEEQIDAVENEVLKRADRSLIGKIFSVKKDILLLHKVLIANREVIVEIEKGYSTRIPSGEAFDFRFIYNDLVQLIDVSETCRDIATGIIEIYLSTVSNVLNNTVKKLTAWGALILIPTLIASVYGMNFQRVSDFNMPELYWPFGYLFALGMMAFSVILLYIYFKFKRWV